MNHVYVITAGFCETYHVVGVAATKLHADTIVRDYNTEHNLDNGAYDAAQATRMVVTGA